MVDFNGFLCGVFKIFFGFFALGKTTKSQQAGLVALALLIVGLFIYSANPEFLQDGYFLTPVTFGVCFVGILAIIFLQRQNQAAFGIILCWALVGLIAPYFPALFQRKLTMMLGIPWGILAGMGIANIIAQRERGQRNLLSSLVILICSATGIQWVQREITLARNNVSNTTVHAVTQPPEVAKMIDVLAPLGRDAIIASLPGAPAPAMDEAGNGIVDMYNTPAIPDLNPVLVGLAGSKAYAGHWSETPAYGERRNKLVEAVRSTSFAGQIAIIHFL
jgi:arabinosyltransferase C